MSSRFIVHLLEIITFIIFICVLSLFLWSCETYSFLLATYRYPSIMTTAPKNKMRNGHWSPASTKAILSRNAFSHFVGARWMWVVNKLRAVAAEERKAAGIRNCDKTNGPLIESHTIDFTFLPRFSNHVDRSELTRFFILLRTPDCCCWMIDIVITISFVCLAIGGAFRDEYLISPATFAHG